MNLEEYNFNVPAFVREADPSKLDAGVPGAVVVGGYRIDNPAAAWVAGAEMRKFAPKMDEAVCNMIKEACSLFNIGDEHFSPVEYKPTISLTDGENIAEFNVFDSESLNKAASQLISNRAELPYALAHDCAVALQGAADKLGAQFSAENQVKIRKMAGDYHVNFEAGKKMLDKAAYEAEIMGMTANAEILKKIANLCTEDCAEELAPLFVSAVDEFRRETAKLNKTASESAKLPEDVFFLSNAEYNARKNQQMLSIDNHRKVGRGALSAADTRQSISKWASMCGYSIPADASAEEIVAAVGSMPSALKDEFIESFA